MHSHNFPLALFELSWIIWKENHNAKIGKKELEKSDSKSNPSCFLTYHKSPSGLHWIVHACFSAFLIMLVNKAHFCLKYIHPDIFICTYVADAC